MIEQITSPSQLKELSKEQLAALAAELRGIITDTVLRNGGHLASNLGMVEATIALHCVFSSPQDKIFFDVGHQSYAHKLLTGRYARFGTLRQYGGISGFPNREESEHDPMTEGHCGTSLSAALGFAEAERLQGRENWMVAVVGDGALTNGMIYEALNNCADRDLRLVILVNDNDMSISRSKGGLHNHLARVRTSKRYFHFKHGLQGFFAHIPLLGRALRAAARQVKLLIKRLFLNTTLFEDLGLDYLGPVDGHDIAWLRTVLEEAKRRKGVCVVHMITQKGKGNSEAEASPEHYHSVGAEGGERDFSACAGEFVLAQAKRENHIVAITAAMRAGVGLTPFALALPERFFDVGIAEEHAVTFAAGLAADGMRPVLFLYSTFAQRAYDQLLHDVAIQALPLTLLIDRAGLVAGDGVTHQGIFDYPLFAPIPNVRITAPVTFAELERCIGEALSYPALAVVRYPKGGEISLSGMIDEDTLAYTPAVAEKRVVILTYGRVTQIALEAAERIGAGVIRLIQIAPLDGARIRALTAGAKLVYVLEEGIRTGGVGEAVAALFGEQGGPGVHIHAIEHLIGHGALGDLFRECGFTAEEIVRRIQKSDENLL